MTMIRNGLAAAALAMGLTPPAQACSLLIFALVPEPPGLSSEESRRFQDKAEEEWRHRELINRQYGLWMKADIVLLAEIAAFQPRTLTFRSGPAMNTIEVHDVVLRPVQRLKGEGEAAPFQIGPTGFSSCGPFPFGSLAHGAPGDMHVVYVAGGPPSQETVMDVIPVAEIVEFQTKSRLPSPQ